MSAATRLARLFDRRFVAGLAVLAGVCVVVALLWGHNVAAMGDGTLSDAYGQVVNYSLATFVYVPICAFSAAGAMRPVASAVWVIRSSRGRTLLAVMGRLMVRALALSALLTLCGLVSVRLFSPTGHAIGAYVAFGLLATILQTLFFLVVCLIVLAVRLLTGSGAYAMLAALGYGALDYLLCMTSALNNSALWTGWLLATAMPEDGLVAEVAGSLRLAALCAFLGLLAVWLVRKKDYLPEEGEPREL